MDQSKHSFDFWQHFQVVTDLDGNFLVQVGSSGEEGLRDGNFDNAMFNRPQVTQNISVSYMLCVL